MKSSRLAATEGEKIGLEPIQRLIPRELLFDPSCASLEGNTCKIACVWSDLEFNQGKKDYSMEEISQKQSQVMINFAASGGSK